MKSKQVQKFKETEFGKIPSEWSLIRFGDYADLKHGHQFRSDDFLEHGLRVLKITQIQKDNTIDISNCSRVSEHRIEELKEFMIEKGDILMALTGAT